VKNNFPTQPQKNSVSAGKVFGIIGVISVLLVASVAIVRKRLNNKKKRVIIL